MSSQPKSQPSAQTIDVEDLVKLVLKGSIRIPSFQRGLRWGIEDARRLFDSILKGYPVGSLLLWKREANAEQVKLGGLRIDAPALKEALWVVDGQQRLTSLANALQDEGKDFALAYDLEKGEIVRSRPESHLIPLPLLFDLTRVLGWFIDHPEYKDQVQKVSDVAKTIRQFKIPAYIVEHERESDLRDIFDRMNNYGKRLSRAEIFAALHPGSAETPNAFEGIIDRVDRDLKFGRLDDDTVLRAVLARRGPNVSRDIRVEFGESAQQTRDFPQETEEVAYEKGEDALFMAIRFLVEEAKIPHFSLLPYRYLLVVLTRWFAHFPQAQARNKQLLRRWFWRAALVGPGVFGGSWTGAMRVLASRIVAGREDESIQRLLEEPIDRKWLELDLKKFRTNHASGKMVLCALWALNPRSPENGVVYSRDELVDGMSDGKVSTVLARFFKGAPTTLAANSFFHVEGTREPATDLFQQNLFWGLGDRAETCSFEELVVSHGMDIECQQLLQSGSMECFLEARERILANTAENFLARMTESSFEDTPPLSNLDLDDYEDDEDEDGPAEEGWNLSEQDP